MLVYLFIFLFAAFLFFKSEKENNYILFYVFVFFYVIISGFRDMIGGFDVYIYGEVYEAPKEFIITYKPFEKGFEYYFVLLKVISSDRIFMFFMTALIMVLLHFRAIKKYSPLVYFSVFLFFCKFFLMSFVYLRQGLAMGIIWLAIPYIQEKKNIKFIALAVLAFLFHKSSIIFAPLFFIAHFQFKKVQLIIIAIVTLIIAVSPIGSFIIATIGESTDNSKIGVYQEFNSGVNYFYFIEVILFSILAIKFRDQFYESKKTTIIYNGFIVFILIEMMALTNATFIRFSWYYLIFVVLFFPYVNNFLIDAKQKKAFKYLIFLYYSLLFFRLLIVYDDGDFLPYKNVFQDFERNGRWEFMEYR